MPGNYLDCFTGAEHNVVGFWGRGFFRQQGYDWC
jgi:hypothetical protein